MVSPNAVYNNTSGVNIKKSVLTEQKNNKTTVELKESLKLVRSDFGDLNKGEVDPKNPACFETNGAFFLLQLMQRNMFTMVLDLKDGEENMIVYPYGSEFGRIFVDL